MSENLWRRKNVVLSKLIIQILAINYEALANLAWDFKGGVEMQYNALVKWNYNYTCQSINLLLVILCLVLN